MRRGVTKGYVTYVAWHPGTGEDSLTRNSQGVPRGLQRGPPNNNSPFTSSEDSKHRVRFRMINKGPSFLAVVYFFGSSPLPDPVSKLDRRYTGRLGKRDNLLSGRGRGWGEESNYMTAAGKPGLP